MRQEKLKQALVKAVDRKDEQLVARLIRDGADINSTFDNDVTLLHLAVRDGDMDKARLLIRHGADAGKPDARGRSALETARFVDARRRDNGIEGASYYTILMEEVSRRHARRTKAQRQLGRHPAP